MHLYWTSLPQLEEVTLSSSIDPQAGSFFLQETVKQVFSISFFVIILRSEPLAQH